MSNAAEETVVHQPKQREHVGSRALFRMRTVPSFYSVAGPKAAAEYYTVRQSLDDQELRRAVKRNAGVLDQ